MSSTARQGATRSSWSRCSPRLQRASRTRFAMQFSRAPPHSARARDACSTRLPSCRCEPSCRYSRHWPETRPTRSPSASRLEFSPRRPPVLCSGTSWLDSRSRKPSRPTRRSGCIARLSQRFPAPPGAPGTWHDSRTMPRRLRTQTLSAATRPQQLSVLRHSARIASRPRSTRARCDTASFPRASAPTSSNAARRSATAPISTTTGSRHSRKRSDTAVPSATRSAKRTPSADSPSSSGAPAASPKLSTRREPPSRCWRRFHLDLSSRMPTRISRSSTRLPLRTEEALLLRPARARARGDARRYRESRSGLC